MILNRYQDRIDPFEFLSGNSGNSAISVKGKGVTNINMCVIFLKLKFSYKSNKCQVSCQ